ncbi:endo-1,4-beta-xylanase [Sanguibacter suaedae]|uniref:Beta-xylanase n=2 Tax=Sanguibacter suaedae TaxID=2795737 RepID=A0A934I6D6_9MICO|nr:endo-1,4-beta-xylanase [Sanguibacter suaedae]MBI9116118.1 endo-1,4-beta-xylanase [Sanguibacter suaedae]
MNGTAPRRWSRVAAVLGSALVAGSLLAPVLTAPASAADREPLRDAAERTGRTVGVALAPHLLDDPAYRSVAEREFSLVVAENAMKWDSTEPNRGTFTWGGADEVAQFAADNDAELYGHTLVWHSQLPSWVSAITDPDDLRTAMTEHVSAVAGRYAGDVTAWDVVNEAFEGDGTRRRSVFQERLGDGYIEDAFRAARAADPDARLCINDYSTDGINAKSTAIYELVRDFLARGVPIDCVGFQSHLIVGQVPSSMEANLRRFSDLGIDVRITELDIRTTTPPTPAALERQAADYRTVVEACLAVTRCDGVTLWGVSDANSWIPGVFPGQGAALLWDEDYATKPAYTAVADALGAGTVDPGPDPTEEPTDPGPDPDPTGPPATSTCEVAFTRHAWDTGFTAALTFTNTGTEPLTGWSLTFDMPAGQSLTQGWSGTWSQTGRTVTVAAPAWATDVAPGGSVSTGFNASHSGDASVPETFEANGVACAVR